MPKVFSNIVPPVLTTAQRDAIASPEVNEIIFNSTEAEYQYYTDTTSPNSWVPLVDSGNIGNTPLGSIDEHSDVDTSTVVPVTGDGLTYDGTNWVPSSTTPDSTNNYVFAYTEAIAAASPVNTYITLSYDNIVSIDGWTVNSPFDGFVAAVTGLFAATIETNVQRAGGGGGSVESDVIARVYGGSPSPVEIPGSHNGIVIGSNNTVFSNSRTFLFNINQGEIFRVEWAGSNASVQLSPGPAPGGANINPSSTVTIRRLT